MITETNQKLKWNIIFSFLILLLGIILLIHMITIEGEPGALPLVLTLTGIAFLIMNSFNLKRSSS